MINILESLSKKDILGSNIGIEREMLRVDENGDLAKSMHPKVFGCRLDNPYITTDFSESQVEVITPVRKSFDETYNFLSNLYNIVAMEIGDELLWPQSMPCEIKNEDDIPIGNYDECGNIADGIAKEESEYRKRIFKKYGGKKQLVSGIHFNLSFSDAIMDALYKNEAKDISFKEFKNKSYLKVTRNYLRYSWIITYLLGATPVIDKTYKEVCKKTSCCNKDRNPMSIRNSDCGYTNKIDLYPDYTSVDTYVNSINSYISDGILDKAKEFYSNIRIKSKNPTDILNSLKNDGIEYVEMRSIDINPFDKAGISLEDIKFVNLFSLFLLLEEEADYDQWQEEGIRNNKAIAVDGLSNIDLSFNGQDISAISYGKHILSRMAKINEVLNLGMEEIVDNKIKVMEDKTLTYAYRIKEITKDKGYIKANLDLALKYKEDAFKSRFNLIGFEDLELSTQILLKEAIKRGVTVEVVDKFDNFIRLSKDGKVEYIKQATKTSKDNYVSVLAMENKQVTKYMLKERNINVPSGYEYSSIEDIKDDFKKLINRPIVVKPKSTNFGLGISIFKDGASEEDLINACEIALSEDNSILIEEFISGREYRILVIGDEVAGILHRVPANVIGDGTSTITQLVESKNKSSLRGKGYKTPLEKIELDNLAELFLKQDGKDFSYIPKKDEVVYLRENSNISTGGDSIDYTDEISEKLKKIAVDASKAMGAEISGVDMMIEDINDEDSNYSIIEMNFNPAIHIHSYPYKGSERNIAKKILKLLELI